MTTLLKKKVWELAVMWKNSVCYFSLQLALQDCALLVSKKHVNFCLQTHFHRGTSSYDSSCERTQLEAKSQSINNSVKRVSISLTFLKLNFYRLFLSCTDDVSRPML